MHIAVCDDNIADRKQLERLLKRESDKRMKEKGADISNQLYTDSFGNSEVLSKNPMQYDLFFIDMTEEEPDGFTFAKQLADAGVQAPIVLCSSKIDYLSKIKELPEQTEQFMHLNKPILTKELSDVLDKALVLCKNRIPTIELRSETDTFYVKEDDIVYAVPNGSYVQVTLRNGTNIPLHTDMFNFYHQVSMFTHMVLINEKGLFNIIDMESYSLFKVTLKNGVQLKSTPFAAKYIKSALHMYRAETL